MAAFALFMGLAGLVFFYIGVSMGWLYVSRHITALYHMTRKFTFLIDIRA